MLQRHAVPITTILRDMMATTKMVASWRPAPNQHKARIVCLRVSAEGCAKPLMQNLVIQVYMLLRCCHRKVTFGLCLAMILNQGGRQATGHNKILRCHNRWVAMVWLAGWPMQLHDVIG